MSSDNRNLPRAAPLLLQMCELSVDVFDRLIPALDGESKDRVQVLANTMRKTIALAKGDTVSVLKGGKHEETEKD